MVQSFGGGFQGAEGGGGGGPRTPSGAELSTGALTAAFAGDDASQEGGCGRGPARGAGLRGRFAPHGAARRRGGRGGCAARGSGSAGEGPAPCNTPSRPATPPPTPRHTSACPSSTLTVPVAMRTGTDRLSRAGVREVGKHPASCPARPALNLTHPPSPAPSGAGFLEAPKKVFGLRHYPPPPPCDSPSGRCFFTGPRTVTRSSLRMLRRVAAFCRPRRPVLLLVSFPRSRSPVVGVPGLC